MRQPDAQDLATKANVLPIMVVRTTFTTVLYMTRVPCVGEIIYIGHSDKDPCSDTNWRVLSVQHMPPVDGHSPSDAVAEIHVIKVEHDDFDPWAGEHPSQQKKS